MYLIFSVSLAERRHLSRVSPPLCVCVYRSECPILDMCTVCMVRAFCFPFLPPYPLPASFSDKKWRRRRRKKGVEPDSRAGGEEVIFSWHKEEGEKRIEMYSSSPVLTYVPCVSTVSSPFSPCVFFLCNPLSSRSLPPPRCRNGVIAPSCVQQWRHRVPKVGLRIVNQACDIRARHIRLSCTTVRTYYQSLPLLQATYLRSLSQL